MLRIRLDLPDPVITTLTSAGPYVCRCNTPLTADDSHHLHVCNTLSSTPAHTKVNEVFIQTAKWAKCSVLGDRGFRKCGLTPNPKYPDGAIYGLQHDGGPVVIDTKVVSPLAASNLGTAMISHCATALSDGRIKFKEYLNRNPTPADFSSLDKSMDDLDNPLRLTDISDQYGKVYFLPLVVEMYGGCAPEVHFLLSAFASRLAEQNPQLASDYLYPYYKSILKKRVSMTLAHQVCINHSKLRYSLLTPPRGDDTGTSIGSSGVNPGVV